MKCKTCGEIMPPLTPNKIADKVYAEIIKGINAALPEMECNIGVSWDGHIIVDGWHFYKGYIKFET